jgi:hypothetical protein
MLPHIGTCGERHPDGGERRHERARNSELTPQVMVVSAARTRVASIVFSAVTTIVPVGAVQARTGGMPGGGSK